MNDTPPVDNLDTNSDDVLREQLRALIPEGAHPSTLDKALAAYRELATHTALETAILFAYQQIVIEGMGSALTVKNAADEAAAGIHSVSKGGIAIPQRFKKRY